MYRVEIDYDEENKIRQLLMYHKVTKVSDYNLLLDNGIVLNIVPNEGCGGCSSGWYKLKELNGCDNVITNVEFKKDALKNSDDDYSYKIFVLAENKKIKLLQVDGTDGNGGYGTGYTIVVKVENKEAFDKIFDKKENIGKGGYGNDFFY